MNAAASQTVAAAVTGFLLATGSIFWSQARVASVYPAFLLSTVLLLTALHWWDQNLKPRRLAAVAAALGLVCVSHKSGFVFVPFVGIFILNRAGRALRDRGNRLALAAFLVPFASLLYVPVRSGFQGFPNLLRDLDATSWQWMTGTAGAQDAELLGAGLLGTLHNLAEVPLLAVAQLSVAGLVLVPMGLWFARSDRLFIWCAFAPAVVISFFSATTAGSWGYWHLPTILVGALAAGYGTAALRNALPKRSRLAVIVTGALALAGMTGAATGAWYVAGQNLSASGWAHAVLSELPPNACVRGDWTAYTALRATQALEGLRPDVRITEAPFTTTSGILLRRSRIRYVVSVSHEKPQAPPGLRIVRVGPRARTNFKGLTGLWFIGPPEARAVMYEVIGSDKSDQPCPLSATVATHPHNLER